MSATIERPAGGATVVSPPDQGGLTPETLATLESIQRRVLWLATNMIHHANHVRPNLDGARSAGTRRPQPRSISILTALYFSLPAPGDRVAVKPHASPAFHAVQYLLGHLPA